ncbi:MAG: DNA-directed RNA polymerase subunit A' [Nanobdellota archaeon]
MAEEGDQIIEQGDEIQKEIAEEEMSAGVEEDEVTEETAGSESEIVEDRMEVYKEFIYKQVDQIEFGMFSPKFVQKMAAAKVVTPELYDKEGYPVDGGLMDIRLGVIDPGLKCKTCGSKLKECNGHFGYIELARPVLHIKYIPVLLALLRTTCRDCGRALLPESRMEALQEHFSTLPKEQDNFDTRRKVIKEMITKEKIKSKCPHCKAKQYPITIEKPTTILENEKRVNPIEIRIRLEKIPNEDLAVFGINHKVMRPEWTVLTIMPIPPVTMRPSITLESGERSEDDLTHKLGDIVRINQRLFENINAGAPEIIIEDLWDLLQYHITTYIDNNVAQLPPARHRSGQPLKTLTERIRSKEGRIRHNLAGKRTNFSARTVISPDPMLDINEVGVPFEMAKKLTVPEVVNEWNLKYLKKFVERGPGNYPGSNYVIRPDGKRRRITDETKEVILEELQPGYIVERHLMDGDISLFNRQPSLHRMSMMCHRVKILPGRTLRINPAVCHPYNADFDGDEMNLHIPQTEEARAEAEILMDVQTQLISPGFGLSIIGGIQDVISGNYMLTKNLLELDRAEAVDILLSAGITDLSRLPNKKKLSGKEVFSMVLPGDFYYEGKSKAADEKGNHEVVIENGMLKKGIMDKSNLGQGAGMLLRTIHKKYGPEKSLKILGNMVRLGIEVLTKKGFTISISDTDLPQEIRDEINDVIAKAYEDVTALIEEFRSGELKPYPGRTQEDTLELRILELLNKTRNKCGNIVLENADKNTHLIMMSDSGARGNPINLAQIAAVVGQQAMRGGRISKGYRNRTLPHFRKKDLGVDAHGFIRNGFKKGLAPHEFFFGAMTGRDSLMDTALRTPKSGYLYRRLANALQDLKVEYDNTVRDASQKIVQFKYGDDGIDVSKSENGVVNVKRIIQEVLHG